MSDSPISSAVTVRRDGPAVIARLALPVPTEADMALLGQKIDQLARETGVTTIAIDLCGVEMLPSLGLGALVQIANKCKARQQKLKLASCGSNLRQTLVLTRLDRFFELVDKLDGG